MDRKYLTAEQLTGIYRQALQQLEAQVVSAWINTLTAPDDAARKAEYDQACQRMQRVESDMQRMLGDTPIPAHVLAQGGA